jgi:hypothetical protein
MTNTGYSVNISWSPLVTPGINLGSNTYATGSTSLGLPGSFGYTQQTYGGYYTATMLEVGIYATGSNYTTALSNLLVIAGSVSNIGMPPLNQSQGRYY